MHPHDDLVKGVVEWIKKQCLSLDHSLFWNNEINVIINMIIIDPGTINILNMKNLDVFSKRFLAITLGLGFLLLSASLFLSSLKTLPAATAGVSNIPDEMKAHARILQDDAQEDDVQALQAFGIGIRDGNLYFGILYNNNTIGLHRSMADGEDVLDW